MPHQNDHTKLKYHKLLVKKILLQNPGNHFFRIIKLSNTKLSISRLLEESKALYVNLILPKCSFPLGTMKERLE
jgi:hypothetical protein